jgi:hypothetical protein
MPQVLYIACSSYSGSTLLAFLLNSHPDIVSVGHMKGWDTGIPRKYIHCSCGQVLDQCPFFQKIREAFDQCGLPFDYNHFGTHYRVVDNNRFNRYLTARLPLISPPWLETARDGLIRLLPPFAAKLSLQDRANVTFIRAALSYGGAKVFADNSATVHRLRHLRRIRELDLATVHLVRDFRGVALSNMKRRGWEPVFATRYWLRQQSDIVRIVERFPKATRVYYEDLCDHTNGTLSGLHTFLGLSPHRFDGDFKGIEHHVLGNVMRQKSSTIVRDTRWQRELSGPDLASITDTAEEFLGRNKNQAVSEIVEHYLNLYS